MCGVAGCLNGSDRWSAQALGQLGTDLAATLEHRGPDDRGVWIDPEHRVVLAHTRLAIIDLSAAGHQPMVSDDGQTVLVYNGEIYNYRALRDELAAAGVACRGNSDTEVLLRGIERWGVQSTLDRCDGMFALAVWDRARMELTLARDRIGEKPLYYGWAGQDLVFASELKALRRHPGFQPEVDREALGLYLRLKYVPAPYSIYARTHKVEPGTIVTFSWGGDAVGQPAIRRYWSLADVAMRARQSVDGWPDDALVQATESELRKAVTSRMVADVTVGAFLSGGVDSSVVTSLMREVSDRPVQTFTIGFGETGWDEAKWARAVAKHLRTEHTELYVTPEEALRVIPRLPEVYDEPFADASGIPTLLVSELARQSVKVCLSGDGGDELFGGYDRYAWTERRWRSISRLPRSVRHTGAHVLASANRRWPELRIPQARWLPPPTRGKQVGHLAGVGARALETTSLRDLYLEVISDWPRPSSVVIDSPPHQSVLPTVELQGAEPREEMTLIDSLSYLPGDILVKVDRASMAVGLEARVPLLSARMIEFSWSLPAAVKWGPRGPKHILREVLARHVPRTLTDRPKMGFGVPIGAWLRGPLRPWAEDMLCPARLGQQGFFDPTVVRTLWDRHIRGYGDWDRPLWPILMFSAWLDGAGTF
jgi:asparagine synthase (glutamine-hydrolysing)